MSASSVINFKQKDIQAFRSLGAFGCEPSLVCEGGVVIDSVPFVDPLVELKRTAGYHIHLGYPQRDGYDIASPGAQRLTSFFKDVETPVKLVQTCDLFVGLVGVLIDPDPVNSWRRQTMGYGRAGEFRTPKWGFEYRVLPNFPLRHPVLAWVVHCLARDAYFAVAWDLKLYDKINMVNVAHAINTNDRDSAAELWLELKNILDEAWFKNKHASALKNRGSTVMFRQETIKKLEFLITHYPLDKKFRTIDLKSWFSSDKSLGLEFFLEEQMQGKYDYAKGRRVSSGHEKIVKEQFAEFSREWELLFDASLLRYF